MTRVLHSCLPADHVRKTAVLRNCRITPARTIRISRIVPVSIRKFRTTAADGKNYQTQFYNLEAIISVGCRHFLPVIEKAREACRNSGHDPVDHFEDILGMVPIGSGAACQRKLVEAYLADGDEL